MNEKTVSLQKLAESLQDSFLDVATQSTPLIIEMDKTPIAAIISIELYDALEEVIKELLSDADTPERDMTEWRLYKLLHPTKEPQDNDSTLPKEGHK